MNDTKSEKERRLAMIEEEFDKIIKDTEDFVLTHLEEDFDPEATKALKSAAMKLAYRKKYYDVMKDRIVFFPSVGRLIMKADLTEEAENFYYDQEDEWPLEYTKALKSVVRAASKTGDGFDEEENEEMEKIATDVEV